MATLVVPDSVPSPTEDSKTLMEACRGAGPDEKVFISILGHRNSSQRRNIRDTYQQLYNEPLTNCLYSELTDHFRRAIILWTHDPAERDAIRANEVLKGRNPQLEVIVEIVCANSPHHLQTVKQAYCALFNSSLEKDIAAVVFSLHLRKLLLGLVGSFRYDKRVVDMQFAHWESADLFEAMQTKELGYDDLIYILSTRNACQLKDSFKMYEQQFKLPIYEDLKSYGGDDLTSLLKVAVQCIVCPEKHFAEVVFPPLLGMHDNDDDTLSGAIISRAEVDMANVRTEYSNMFEANLDDDVAEHSFGDNTKSLIMTLLGAGV
ncbi:unnamed protein product [Linum tenue]|uniref:Uncharacterized protein n=1 Tax=Linum tenue TaxID=586396 RepID=A0AAV0GVN8_9ROSI|nr:unnamed protein product [Linum tenue]